VGVLTEFICLRISFCCALLKNIMAFCSIKVEKILLAELALAVSQ